MFVSGVENKEGVDVLYMGVCVGVSSRAKGWWGGVVSVGEDEDEDVEAEEEHSSSLVCSMTVGSSDT